MKQTSPKNSKSNMSREHVISVFREILSDPELDLPLTRSAISRLKKSVIAKDSGRYKDLSEVL